MGGNDNVITEAYDARFITKVGGPISQFYVYRTDGLLTTTTLNLVLMVSMTNPVLVFLS